MQTKLPDEDLANMDDRLQALFRSLAQEWEDTAKAKKKVDPDAFMAKWVAGVQAIFSTEDLPLGAKQPPDNLVSQGLSASEEFPGKPPTPQPLISQAEKEALLHIMANLPGSSKRTAPPAAAPLFSLLLEVKPEKGLPAEMIPVRLKNLYQGTVVLEVNKFGVLRNPQILQEKKGLLHLTNLETQESLNITGRLTWIASKAEQKLRLNLNFPDNKSNKAATKFLEHCLAAAPKDRKKLWEMWDKIRLIQETAPSDQRDKYILLLLTCGTLASGFLDPKLFWAMKYMFASMGVGKIIKFFQERKF
jgi:hypothetical protein